MSAAEKAEVRAMNLDEKEVLAVETFKLASQQKPADPGFQTTTLLPKKAKTSSRLIL